MTAIARRFIVHGRVQGVWFRDSTRREAQRLGIVGHALNLPDGSVEVFACGSPGELRELETWLRQGPPLANVARVESSEAEPTGVQEFRIG